MFTSFIGDYDYNAAVDGFEISGSILVMGHKFISSIFLLNFLIAILSAVYDYMQDEGEFEFKKCKYEFIEKYSIALMDPHGYYELVIHPPPINFFTIFLLPFMIKGSIMKAGSRVFAKFIFWFENSFFMLYFIGYLFCLWPLIIIKVLVNIFRLASIFTMLPMAIFWIIISPFFLLYGVFKDMFYLVKILCDYQEEEDSFKEKEEEDFKQDKIVIYNEVIDVMRSILHLFKKKKD